jgi:hypothetical protein
MNEEVFVHFICTDREEVLDELKKYLTNEKIISLTVMGEYPHVFGCRMEAQLATLISMQNKYLSDRMAISYISDDLKNKYRKT